MSLRIKRLLPGVKRGAQKILAVISSCGGGDWPPLLALVLELQCRGHQVVVVCDAATKAAVRAAGCSPICLPSRLHLTKYFKPAIDAFLSGGDRLTATSPNPLLAWAEASTSFVLEAMDNWRPTLILGSLFGQYLAELLATACGVRWCCVNPSFYFGDRHYLPRRDDFSPVALKMYTHWLLPPLRRAHLVLHATDPLFDLPDHPLPSDHLYSGPLFWEMAIELPWSLQTYSPSPWVLIALSTAPQDGEEAIVQMAALVLADGQRQVLVTGPSCRRIGSTIGLPANFHFAEYLPHQAVLERCGLVISHAGHGLVLKALHSGVPMVLVPWGRDQPGVARRAAVRGAVRVVDRECLNRALLGEAIQSLQDPACIFRAERESLRLRQNNSMVEVHKRLEALF